MLIGSEFLIISIVALMVMILINPLILLEGFAKILKRQRKSHITRPSRETERKILSYHQKSIEKMEKQLQTEVRSELMTMASKHSETLAKLAKTIGGDYEKNRQEIKNTAQKFLEETKLALAGLVAETEKRVNEELSQELAEARAEINTYKEKRMKKIDAEIAAIVEKTIYRTLGKGLSLKDQIDIIYESLAEAKEEGFFGKNAASKIASAEEGKGTKK